MSLLPAAPFTDLRFWNLRFIRVDLWLHFWIYGLQILPSGFSLLAIQWIG